MGVLASIQSGKYDELLDQIIREATNRKADLVWNLQPGDKVRLSKNARPAYIAGKIGTIREFRRSRVLVILDNPPIGTRFSRGIICHLQSLSPVKEVSNAKGT